MSLEFYARLLMKLTATSDKTKSAGLV